MDDSRFKHIKTDPKFRRIPKSTQKVKIDSRFRSMFKDKQFKVKYTVDKRGRPVNHTSREDLKRYYDVSSSSDEEDEAKQDELEVTDKNDKIVPDDIKQKLKNLKVDYARGESKLLSESSSDDEVTEEESEDEDIEHKWGELDNDAETTEHISHRLAACNMDWDRMRAVDLMVLFNSFLPAGGAIKSVSIYTSEYGKKRIQEEDERGPQELVEEKDAPEDDTEEGARYHMEKLRQYQLNRLKYYYTVITFDSANTANKVYTECDGMEYESSATKMDLRFVPDDMTFEDEPKETCDRLPEKYQPRFFTTTALQQAKVDLTWDETDPGRLEFTQRVNSGKMDDLELGNYVAFSSEESAVESGEENSKESGNPIEKYKQLLLEIEEKDKKKDDVEMEVTWGLDLEQKTEDLVKKKIEEKISQTPFEKYLDKKREKRKEKRKKTKEQEEESDDMPSDIDVNDPYFAEELNNPEFQQKKRKLTKKDSSRAEEPDAELELLVMNDEPDSKHHFSMKKIQDRETKNQQKKSKKKKTVNEEVSNDFEMNVNDDRFSALFTSHLYNVDPTDPHFKKTKGMEKLIEEKIKRRKETDELPNKSVKKDAELSVLVKSVKSKTQNVLKKTR